MFNLKSTQEIYDFVSNRYTRTAINQGHYGFILHGLESFDSPFGDRMLESFDDVDKQSTLNARVMNLRSVGNLLEVDFGNQYTDEFNRIADKASLKTVQPTNETARYLSPEDALDYFKSIKSPVGGAIQCLAYIAGLTPNCLLRDLNNLSFLKDGVAVIGEKLNRCNTAPRTVFFNPDWLNQLDPNGEVIGVVQGIAEKVTQDNAGELAERLGDYYNGCGYSIHDLRNSNAINLDRKGYLKEEVAEIQGVQKKSLTNRLVNFRRKTGIN